MLIGADPVQVPVAGRPVDFSGAVGGPFRVKYAIDDTYTILGNPHIVSILITGPGDVTNVQPPDLQDMPGVKNKVVVDSVSRRIVTTPPGIAFDYSLRVRECGVLTFSRWKFVYYSAELRSWQTTYAGPISVNVWSSHDAALNGYNRTTSDAPPELRKWTEREDWRQRPAGFLAYIYPILKRVGIGFPAPENARSNQTAWFWVVPPLLCGILARHYRRRPDDRLSVPAVSALSSLNSKNSDATRLVRDVLLRFLCDEVKMPVTCNTVPEVLAFSQVRTPLVAALEQCDLHRFGPAYPQDEDLLAKARQAVAAWEFAK